MKKIIWTLIIILLLGTGFRYVIFNTDILDNFLGQKPATWESNITEQYTVKIITGDDEHPGENIYVYDSAWSMVFSLLLDKELFQWYKGIVWNNLIVDHGSSNDRIFYVYDIPSKQKKFEANYHWAGTGLEITGTQITFYSSVRAEYQLDTPKPTNAPTCIPPNNGYIVYKIYDTISNSIISTWPLECSYFE